MRCWGVAVEPPLLADFIHARVCKPFCAKTLDTPKSLHDLKNRLLSGRLTLRKTTGFLFGKFTIQKVGRNCYIAADFCDFAQSPRGAQIASIGSRHFSVSLWGVAVPARGADCIIRTRSSRKQLFAVAVPARGADCILQPG